MGKPQNSIVQNGAGTQLSLHLGFVLNRAAQALRDRFELALEPLKIKPRHYGVLAVIAECETLPQYAIGEILCCDRNAMVGIVDDLEKLDLARRQVNRLDRRAHTVALTPAGKRLLEKANMIAARIEQEFLAPLSATERRQMQQMLERLAAPRES